MDKALKIGRLIAYAAETIMVTFLVADTIDSISERRAKGKASNANGIPADGKVPASTNS